MNKIGVIGGRDSVLGFRALGLDTCIAENGEQAKAASPHGEGELRHHLYHRTPRRADPRGDRASARGCFARRHPHPGQEGSLSIGTAGVHAAAEKAVGADIL